MIESESSAELAVERMEKLAALLRQSGAMRVRDISKALGVSEATVRRDLSDLDACGRIRRVHGGAVAVDGMLDEPVFDDKAAIAAGEKQLIAEKALAKINQGSSIFLDGGSTVLALARLLIERRDLTVVTNSFRVAATLSHAGPSVILIGGELRRISQTFVGPLTRFLMENLSFDLAFIGTMGITVEEGLTTTDPGEAYTKTLALKSARRVVLLADSSKIGAVSFVSFGSLKDVDVLITDSNISAKSAKMIRKQGVEVEISGLRQKK